ncbi:LOW QUALITY PROTEIN: uncharacterized protein LOC135223348 [Macrobrachium nipponense]|uniref:LOW QUALITY PROTEIN: uncharacterized protein LOC135223348 n=1 Tax=Macrobrachium nipponense TaxID=159736 RepID=UPI0030C814F2
MECTRNPELLDFEGSGFHNIILQKNKDFVRLRTNAKSREDFDKWREIFNLKNCMCFNSYKLYPVGVKKLFRQKLLCHHSNKFKHKGVKKTVTGCEVFVDATIRIIHKQSLKRDKLMESFPCFIEIHGWHNHSLDSADALNQLRVTSSTRDTFERYFEQEILTTGTHATALSLGSREQSMTTAMAHRHHLMKLDLVDDLRGQANKSVNPSLKSVEYMRTQWVKEQHGGLNTLSMFNAIHKYAADNPEVQIKVEHNDERFCVVLVTPFMKRVHEHLREASEVVFVDATGICRGDQLNTAIIPFICAGPAGAVPLAVLFTSCQDQVTLTRGFGMIKEMLGECAFYGRGAPQSFMTDNCEAERKSLAATWPTANRFLCIFHLLQQVWRWLLDSKHRIQKDNRQDLMAAMKSLVYASSKAEFNEVWQSLQSCSLMATYPIFKSYVASLVERKEDWAIAFRAGTLLRGHHTNNFCESTMCIIKDIVLSRCKAYNTAQLLMFMVEIFDVYMRQRLVDVALSRRHVKPIISTKVALDSVELVGNSKYKVQSESDPTIKYDIDLEIGLCSCMQGQTGAICKHQIACAEFSMTAVPQQFLSSSESRHRLAVLAVGQEKVPDVAFFRKLNEDGGFEITGKADIKEIVSERTENLDDERATGSNFYNRDNVISDDDDFALEKYHMMLQMP